MYQFKLKWWVDNNKEEICGLVAGTSYPDAMANLMQYAAGEHVVDCTLKELGDYDNVIIYNDNAFDISRHLT